MIVEFKCRFSGTVRFRGDYPTTKAALVAAVAAGVYLGGIDLRGEDLDGARLVGASLDGARLVGASLVGARLDRASLVGARLDRASLVGARLDRARLVGASLDGARLVGASLDGANVSRVTGVIAVSVTWPGHGECGRQLLAVRNAEGTVYHCGCFRGDRDALLKYIKEGETKHRPSRTLTLDVVDMLLAASESKGATA